MATTRTWNGAIADWNTAADWSPATPGNGVPQPGDTAIIASGTVILTTDAGSKDKLFETNPITLGGAIGTTLLLRNVPPTGRYFSVTIAGNATIEADGNRGFAGSITGSPNDGSTITFKADQGGNFVLLHGGSFNVADRTVDFEGNVTLERDAMVSGNIVNNGVLSVLSGKTTFATNDLSGTGTIAIGGNGEFSLGGNQFSGASQTISFAGLGGQLDFSYQSTSFAGSIKNFASGDFIDFVAGQGNVTSASLNTTAHTLTIVDSGGDNYVFNNFYGQAGALTVQHQSNGHDQIGYAGAAPRLDYQIDAGSRAMHADAVHQMDVPGTATPITGTGVKIGIISDSFNIKGGAAADVTAGYLPANGVTVLREGSAGNEDEGRAMAELIHQSAPGASLYFASTGSGVDDFATSVQSLQSAGCTVIVDDISFGGGEPFFQLGSPAENAISKAIAAGVTCVSSCGNFGNAFYQHSFTTSQQTLPDGSQAQAMTFSNGTPYQSVTAIGGLYDTIDLQWDAPFYGTGGVASDQPCSVSVKAFDPTTNQLVGTSTQVSLNGHLVAESELALPGSNSTKTYNLAIYQNAGTPAVSQIKYIISGVSPSGGTGVGGRINDPDAGVGSGAALGHALVPGTIATAAMDVTNTPAAGRLPDFTEYFSSTGPGTLLFDAQGNRLAQPMTVGSPDVTGPDAIQTSVPDGFMPFYGTSAAAPNVAAVAALLQQVDPNLSPADISSILAQSAKPLSGETDSMAGAGLVQADKAIMLAEQVTCFASGTRIRTARGDVTVEDLQIGDAAITASGDARPIRWIGHRTIDCRAHPDPRSAWPVRVAAHAFGDGLPSADLFLSTGHSVKLGVMDDVLIPIGKLVNGATIARHPVDEVTYWHVELDSHDVLIANDLPAESFLDCGNRDALLEQAGGYDRLAGPHTPADFCLPYVDEGAVLDAVREQLAARAAQLGWTLTHDMDLHLIVDGVRMAPDVADGIARFFVPVDAEAVALVCATQVPSDLADVPDHRRLGVSILGLETDDGLGGHARIALDDERLAAGWHPQEAAAGQPHRFTTGHLALPSSLWAGCRGQVALHVHHDPQSGARWLSPDGGADTPATAHHRSPSICAPTTAIARSYTGAAFQAWMAAKFASPGW